MLACNCGEVFRKLLPPPYWIELWLYVCNYLPNYNASQYSYIYIHIAILGYYSYSYTLVSSIAAHPLQRESISNTR